MAQSQSELLSQLSLDKTAMAQRPSKMPFLLSSLVGLVIGLGVGWGLFSSASVAPSGNSPSIQVTSAAELTVADPSEPERALPLSQNEKVLDASGYVTARRVATVSAEVMGLLLSVDVEEGMAVKEGQVLAQIDDSVAKIQLGVSRAQVEAQEAKIQSLVVALSEAKREWRRLQNLGGAGDYASDAQLSAAQTAVERLQASVRGAHADLKIAQLNVSQQENAVQDHRIRAPFTGVVTGKNAQAGEIVSPSSAGGGFTRTGICTIVDMDSLEIEVDVNEAFIGRVRAGQGVIATLDAYPDWQIPAQVAAVIPAANRAKATVRVRIRILQKDSKILPDMGVKVSFLGEEGES